MAINPTITLAFTSYFIKNKMFSNKRPQSGAEVVKLT